MKLLLSLALILTFSTSFFSYSNTATTDITVGKKLFYNQKYLTKIGQSASSYLTL
ncbi:hypothetical protein ATS73_011440 [Pseudoalteromonas sp. H100]|nr:hypothetical protein [Pseudoalteromonas sp. H100]WFO18710.1 hypothetical protein ATS73_011440 [Pseudoalteromonas sp. H100]